MMVIAESMVSAYQELLDDPAGVLSPDARNRSFPHTEGDPPSDLDLAFLSRGALPDPDAGCIIGVIDDAIPFVHQRFTLPGNLSRVASVWLQDAPFRPQVGRDLPTGAEWRGAALSKLLKRAAKGKIAGEDGIYHWTGAVDMMRPAPPSGAFETGHGAAVAPLAAGFDPTDPQARNHPLIAVCLPPRIVADSMGVLAPIPILAGIVFIINRACRLCRFIEDLTGRAENSVKLPVVINLSLGLTAGARDGTSPLEQFMDAVSDHVSDRLGRVHFVLPSGNHRLGRLRARLHPGQDIAWRLPPDDPTINAIEIWGPPYNHRPGGKLQVTLTVPGLAPATTALRTPWQFSDLNDAHGRRLARAYYTPHKQADGQWRDGIVVIATPTCPERLDQPFAPPGEWRVAIPQDMDPGSYDLSAQRDEVIRGFRKAARQSWFHDSDYHAHDKAGRPILQDAQNGGPSRVIRSDTVNTYATGRWPLRVGAVYRQSGLPTAYTSLLPDPQTGGQAEAEAGDCLAPVDVSVNTPGMIVCGRDSGSATLSSGTSLAAPLLARWLAGQLSRGERPDSRAAIRALAQQQATRPGPTPIVDFPPRFREF